MEMVAGMGTAVVLDMGADMFPEERQDMGKLRRHCPCQHLHRRVMEATKKDTSNITKVNGNFCQTNPLYNNKNFVIKKL